MGVRAGITKGRVRPLLLAGLAIWSCWRLDAAAQSIPPTTNGRAAAGGTLAGQQPTLFQQPPKSQAFPAEVLPGGRQAPPDLPQVFRWTEDWSKSPPSDAPFLDKIEHISLAPEGVYLSLAGEERLYSMNWNHASLGVRPNDTESILTNRFRVLGDLHLGPDVRAYLELGDSREFGETFPTVPNRDRLDVYQAFLDLTLPLGELGSLTLRPGRFEMPLGNAKLVGVRDGPGLRFTYQGVQATYIIPGTLSVDAFSVRPVMIRAGTFDDGPNRSVTFDGVYISAPNRLGGFGVDAFGYSFDRATGVTREATGKDDRNTYGLRLWKRDRTFDLDLETDHQSGRLANQAISAYAVLFDSGITAADVWMHPRLGIRTDVFSGDGNLGNGHAGTFVAPAPGVSLITEGATFTFSNLVDLYPSLSVKPREDVVLRVGPDFLFRNSRQDGVYVGPAGTSFAPYASSRFTGTNLNVDLAWQATKRLQLHFWETYFTASDSFEKDCGKDSNYVGFQTDLRF